METAAGRRFDLVENEFAIAERVEDRSNTTELHGHVAEKQHDVGDATHLEQGSSDVLGSRRSLDLHKFFGRQDERHLVGETADPVDAVDQRGDLGVGTHLGEFFISPVHVPHDGFRRDDLLAVEAGNDT